MSTNAPAKADIALWPTADERARERAAKRDAVLRVAVRLFNEKGFRATSLDDVAGVLNVTKPTIYHYFANKDEVLFACVQLGLDHIREAVAAAVTRPGTGRDRLEALLLAYAEMMTQDFGICVIRTSERELSAESAKRFRVLKRDIDSIIRSVIADGVADGSLAVKDVRLCAFAFAGALNGLSQWFDPAGPDDAAAVARGMVGQLMAGV